MRTWKSLRYFCQRDGWELYKSTDHDFYRKFLPDGTEKRTKVSRGTGEIPKPLWHRILKHQLQVTQQQFDDKLKG